MVNPLQDLPAPHSHGIRALQITDPIQDHLRRLIHLGLEPGPAQLRAYRLQHGIVPRHVEDEQDAEKVLRPAEEIGH